jgi:recombination protein RecA
MVRAAATESALDALLKTSNKKFNLSVGGMEDIAEDVVRVSTGNIAIDAALGGGIPLGRSTELYGPPSCGKTTTALQAAVWTQNVIKGGGSTELGISKDDRMVYFDYEYAMDKEYAKALGLDVEHRSLLFTQPDTLEDGANFALKAAETGEIRFMIFDSVAAMNPSAKAEAEIGKPLPAVQAKLMKDFGVNLNSIIARNNCGVVFLNHEHEKMSMNARPGMPPQITTPGGVATKYFASVRVRYQRIRENRGEMTDPITNEKISVPISSDVKVKTTKNKTFSPFREATVRVRFGRGFDNFWTALQILIANKKIMYEASRYYFHNLADQGGAPEWMDRAKTGTQRPLIHGEANVFDAADEHTEWRDLLIDIAAKIVEDNSGNLDRVVRAGEEEAEIDEDIEGALADLPTSGNRVTIG